MEPLLNSNEPVLMRGTPQHERRQQDADDSAESKPEIKLRAAGVELLSEARARRARRMDLAIPVYALDNDRLVRLKELLTANRGEVPTQLTITEPNLFETVIALPEALKVNLTDELLVRVDRLFEQKVVRLT